MTAVPKREILKEKLKVQLGYVSEFLRKDTENDHVRYDPRLINPSVYIAASFVAFGLYYDYLYTNHVERLSHSLNSFMMKFDPTYLNASVQQERVSINCYP